ncbi:MAG: acetylornithine deacetylase [Alphaproteobacteria bacterium]|nr:acetylornithine deacetylase [Alphaproteobacteria bacterium]
MDAKRPSAAILSILKDLVAFDSTSRNSNLPIINYVQDYLKRYGIEAYLITSSDGTKANLWASIGPHHLPGVILSGHTDVVPVDGQNWSHDPFLLIERDEKLFGRGACDMKGFLAVVLAAVPKIVSSNLRMPVRIAFSHDEEVGCIGVKSLIDWLKNQPVRDELCIVGEPTDMQPVIGHKGGRAYRVIIEGREAHSSLAPHAVNAIDAAAELIIFLKQISNELKLGSHDEAYDIKHSTLSTGLIQGGSAINIVPKKCEFVFEYRHLLGFDAQALAERVFQYAKEVILPPMQEIAPEASIRFEEIYSYPALAIDVNHQAVGYIKNLAKRNDESKVAYGTEGGFFMNELDIPTVVCGPGSIKQAHTPDEYIFMEQLALCEDFLERLIRNISKAE